MTTRLTIPLREASALSGIPVKRLRALMLAGELGGYTSPKGRVMRPNWIALMKLCGTPEAAMQRFAAELLGQLGGSVSRSPEASSARGSSACRNRRRLGEDSSPQTSADPQTADSERRPLSSPVSTNRSSVQSATGREAARQIARIRRTSERLDQPGPHGLEEIPDDES